jgi:lactoylglutathione lyase
MAVKEITRINHVGLRVRDLAVTREFYERLGFEFLAGPVGPDSSLKNLLMDEPKKHTGYTHIALEISDAESVEHQLDAASIEITEKVEFGGAYFFFVRDPDGNVIEFHRPAA